MRITAFFSVLLIVMPLTSSCVTNHSRTSIKEDHRVTTIFRNYEINPDYNYFYYGTLLEPDAILGIRRDYNVQTKFWTEIDLTREQLETWITTLDRVRDYETFAYRYFGRYQGSRVVNPQGETIGVWYSKLDWGVFEFPEEKTIVPFTPSLRPESRRFGLLWDRADP